MFAPDALPVAVRADSIVAVGARLAIVGALLALPPDVADATAVRSASSVLAPKGKARPAT